MKLLLHVYIFVTSSTLDMLPCDNIVRQTLLTKLYKEENRGSEYLNVWWTCASDASSTSLCGHCSYLIHMLLHIERLSCCNGKSLAQARKCNFFFSNKREPTIMAAETLSLICARENRLYC